MNRFCSPIVKTAKDFCKNSAAKPEKPLENNEADVAELVDARDLKSVGFIDSIEVFCKKLPANPVENPSEQPHL